MNSDESLAKSRQSVLDVGQRNQFDAVQGELRRTNEALTTSRRENKELRSAAQQSLRGQRNNLGISEHYAKEEEMLHNKTCVLKRSLNAVKGKNSELAKEIDKTSEDNVHVQNEGSSAVVSESSSVAKKIRALENRLDKCLIKHNEVNAIRSTYETLLERLQLEQFGFDTQLMSTEKALLSAERELGELTEVGQQASKGKDAVRAEVSRLRAKLSDDRRTQAKDIEQRRAFIQERREALERKHTALLLRMVQQEERHARTLQAVTGGGGAGGANGGGGSKHRRLDGADGGTATWLASLSAADVDDLHRQKEAYLRLREDTTAPNMAEVIRLVLERRDSHDQLQATADGLAAEMAAGQESRLRTQAAWEELSQRGGKAMVTAKATRTARDEKKARDNRAEGDSDDDNAGDGGNTAVAAATTTGAGGGALSLEPDYGLLASRLRQNRAILAEFAGHLADRESQLEEAQRRQDALSQLVTDAEAGVRHLAEKLSLCPNTINNMINIHGNASGSTPSGGTSPAAGISGGGGAGSGSAAAASYMTTSFAALIRDKDVGEAALISTTETADLLRSCDARMQVMMDAVGLAEVDAVTRGLPTARVIVPATNVRIAAIAAAAAAAGNHRDTSSRYNAAGDEFEDVSSGAAANHSHISKHDDRGNRHHGNNGDGDDDDGDSVDNDRNAAALVGATGAVFEDFPESEIHDRRELKMMALATVEREQTKMLRKRMATREDIV